MKDLNGWVIVKATAIVCLVLAFVCGIAVAWTAVEWSVAGRLALTAGVFLVAAIVAAICAIDEW